MDQNSFVKLGKILQKMTNLDARLARFKKRENKMDSFLPMESSDTGGQVTDKIL